MAYSRPDGTDDQASWYGYRLTGVPWRALRQDFTLNEWNQIILDAPNGTEDNQITFFDTSVSNGFDGQPTWTDLMGTHAFDWSSYNSNVSATARDYAAENVLYLSVHTSTGWETFSGCVDGLTLEATDGRQIIVDLE